MRWVKWAVAAACVAGLAASAHAKILAKEDFSNWRDESTNPGFNAKFKGKEKDLATIAPTSGNSFGKVMSAETGFALDIDQNLTLQFKLLKDISDGSVTVNLMTAAEPYDAHAVFSNLSQKGTYTAKIAEKTPWTGKHSFWIEVWVGGTTDTIAVFEAPLLTDGTDSGTPVKAVKKKGKKKSAAR